MKQKCHPFGWHLSLSIKSVFTPKQQSRGSAHSTAFAAQTHENRGRVPRFSYFKREKVSVWELSDVRVLRSQNTDCRKNDSFSTVSGAIRRDGTFVSCETKAWNKWRNCSTWNIGAKQGGTVSRETFSGRSMFHVKQRTRKQTHVSHETFSAEGNVQAKILG